MGSVYLSTSATDPATLFGRTWERIQDRFLLCAGTTYAAGSEGGEAKHKLTVKEMPSHAHNIVAKKINDSQLGYNIACRDYTSTYGFTGTTETTGGGAAHNNMPPYLAVYAWERVA